MLRGLAIFGALNALFFAIPFPMILYYKINDETDIAALSGKQPWLVLGILAITGILWALLLAGYFRKWVLRTFAIKKRMIWLREHGIRRSAEVLSAKKISNEGAPFHTYELRLAFKNLVNTDIVQKAAVNDTRPDERRFEPGKKTELLIDPGMSAIPYFTFAGAEASISKTIVALIVLGWLALVALVAGYYVFSYQFESYGMGWRFLSFAHPLLVCPAILLCYRLILRLFAGSFKPEEAACIKFNGIRTTARLIHSAQTGMYINEQPMVRFTLGFTDHHQQKHQVSLKKVVDLLHLDITRRETLDIFYLKDNPQRVAFADDLDEIS